METDRIELTLDEVNRLDEEFEKYFIEAIQKQKCFSSEINCTNKIHRDIAWSRITKCLERSTNDNVKKWYSLLHSFSDLSKKADKDDDLYFEVMEWPCYEEFQLKMEKYKDLLNSGVNDTNVAKITETQMEILLTELENYSKEIFSVYISKAQRQHIWNLIATNLNLIETGPLLSAIELQRIWLDIKFKTELRERQKLLGTSPEDMRILKICRITSIEEFQIIKALESYNEFGVETDHLKCERCELLNHNAGVFRLCFACSKTNLVICDICFIKPSIKVYSTKYWSSAAKELIPSSLDKEAIWMCDHCKTNLLEQASLIWKVCRFCAQESSTYIPTNKSFLSQFCKEFNSVFKQKLVFGLGLPSNICSKCFEKFESIKRFYHDLKRTQVTLLQIHKEKFIGNFIGNWESENTENGREKVPNKPFEKLNGANSKSDKDTSKENELIKQNESCTPKLSDCQPEKSTLQKIKVKTVTTLNAEIPQEILNTLQTPNSISTLENTTNLMCENDLNQTFSMVLPNYKIFNIRNDILPTQIQPHSFVAKRRKINPKCQEVDPSSKTFPAKVVFVKKETDLLKEDPKVDFTARQTPNVTTSDKSKPVSPMCPDICPKVQINKTIQQTPRSPEKSTKIQNISYQPKKRIKISPKCQEVDPSSKTFPAKVVIAKKETDLIKEVPKVDFTARQTSNVTSSDKSKPVNPMCPDISPKVQTNKTIQQTPRSPEKNTKIQNISYQQSVPFSEKPPNKIKTHKVIKLINKPLDARLTTQQAPKTSDSEKSTKPIRQNILYQLKRVTISKDPPISMLVKTGFNIIQDEHEKNVIKSAKHPKSKNVLQRLYGIKVSKRPSSKLKEKKGTSLKVAEPKANLTTDQSPHSSSAQKITRNPSFLDVLDQPSSPERITASPCPYTSCTDNTVQGRKLIESKDEDDFDICSIIKSLSSSSPKQNESTSIRFDALDEIKTEEIATPVVQLDSLQSVNTSSNSKHHSITPFKGFLEEASKNEIFECYLSENQAGKSVLEISQSQQSLVNRPNNVLLSQVFSNTFEMEVHQKQVINPLDASMDAEIKEELSETDPLLGEVEKGEELKVGTDSALYKCEEFIGQLILGDNTVNKMIKEKKRKRKEKEKEKEDKTLQRNTSGTVREQTDSQNNLRLCGRDKHVSKREDKNTTGKRETNEIDKPLRLIEKFVYNKKDKVTKKNILTSGSSKGPNFESRRTLRKRTTA